MRAAGHLRWGHHNPLCVGDAATRHSRIVSLHSTSGRSGELLFVRVRHAVHNVHGLCLTEEHGIVYRPAAAPGESASDPVAAEARAVWRRQIVPGEVLWFRCCALTFNGHRIHHDRRYAIDVEGYPGLVVHGPLIATLLADPVRRRAPQRLLRRFEFKAVRPTFDGHPFFVNGEPDDPRVRLWAHDHAGCPTVQATVEWD